MPESACGSGVQARYEDWGALCTPDDERPDLAAPGFPVDLACKKRGRTPAPNGHTLLQ